MRTLLFLTIVLVVSGAYLGVTANCGKSTGAPPVVLPAPEAGNITVTAPDADGNVRVIGETDSVAANAEVTVTNKSRSTSIVARSTSSYLSVTVIADADGAFIAEIAADVGDIITVSYVDPATNEASEALETTVPSDVVPTGTKEFNIYDVALGTEATAYIVSNDGTASEITVVNMVSKETTRYQFAGKLFDLIAVSAGIGYAVVIDSTYGKLYWYDLQTLEDNATPKSEISVSNPTNVNVSEFNDPDVADIVSVTHEVQDNSVTFFEIEGDNTLSPPVTYCFGTPDEYDVARPCSEDTVVHTKAVDAVMLSSSGPAGFVITGHADESWYGHWYYFWQDQEGNSQVASYYSYALSGAGERAGEPTSIGLYGDYVLITDASKNKLYKIAVAMEGGYLLEDINASYSASTTFIDVGTSPVDIVVDDTGKRAFVANKGSDNISVVDLNSSSSTADTVTSTIEAKFAPGPLVYDSTKNLLGVVLTGSNALGIISP